ncbi:lipopolysaccharide biosynthesis protein [Cohnella soli]|uniref:Lipopolysaccharide biosynthesis protein n=1 Tax=Cohnella soli TaxID=425005 RepID=A0ABW0I2T4_9BACL
MRIQHTIVNIAAGVGNQLVITALSFISRTVFIQSLGIEYLGVNGLFTNILAMLSLAEAGIGSSIMYSLYKPVAEGDRDKINKLMRLYRNAYLVIAAIVALLGLALLPFLHEFVKNTDVPNLTGIYLIFLLNTVSPYFFSYKNAFLNVNQKGYIVTLTFSVSSIVSSLLKIGILYYTQDYILFLIIDSLFTVGTAATLNVIANRKYPYLKDKVKAKLDQPTKVGIVKNVKAIILQNVGSYLVLGTENILISTYVSVAAVGLYSNYKMLIEIGRTFIYQVFNNMYHSVGNLVTMEKEDKIYSVYKVMLLLSFWLYSLFAIVLYIVIGPFITLWIGSSYLMSNSVLILLLLLFVERGMRNSISTVKTTAGIFHEDRFVPLVQAAVSLLVSIALVQRIGIAGVFIGSFVSALVLPFWTTPYLVYKKVFLRPVLFHYRIYAAYIVIGFGTFYAAKHLAGLVHGDGVTAIIAKSSIASVSVMALYLIVFWKTDEFAYLRGLARLLSGKLISRIKSNKQAEV